MNDLGHVLIRGVLGFVLLLILVRLNGKKQITQVTYFEYIVGIVIGGIAAELTFSPHVRMSNFILGMLIWAFLSLLTAYLNLKSHRFHTLTEGSPTVFINNGKILEKNLKKERVTIDELMLHLREKNVFKVSDVEMAVMETNGKLSVMKKRDVQPLTPKDVGLVVESEHQPHLVIMDGNALEKNLNALGYTKEWLLGEIMKQGAQDFHDVFLAQIDSMGNVYVDLYHDHLKMPQIKQKLLTAANIKQLQASLVQFSLQTENKEAKKMYQTYAKQLNQLIDEMSVYLKE